MTHPAMPAALQMNKHIRWLHEQLPSWVTQGVVAPAQADAIRKLYPEPKAAQPWGMIIFSGIGAVIIGLGVILLLAYNWNAIPKFGKLGLSFAALIAAQLAGQRLFQRPDWRRQLGEAIAILGTMLFGAGIWLVAQVYHIDEHYPNGFLLWAAGALALAWAMPSVAQGMLAALALTIWGSTENFGFHSPVHWAPLLLAVSVGGLAWKERSRFLLVVVLGGFYFLLLANIEDASGHLAFPAALHISVLLVALRFFARHIKRFPGSAAVLNFFGWAGFLVVVFILSFPASIGESLRWHEEMVSERRWLLLSLYGWLPFVLMLAAWAWVAVSAWRKRTESAALPAEQWLLPLTALLCQVLAVALPTAGRETIEDSQIFIAGVLNLIFLAVATMWMARGCREGELKPVILGSILLVSLVFARYFDLFESLAVRGLIFLVVGGVLFAEGFFYRRARERAEERRPSP
jgi:uncharacterized membrane protein